MELSIVGVLAGLLFTAGIRNAHDPSLRTDGVDNQALLDAEQARAEQAGRRVQELTGAIDDLTGESTDDAAVSRLQAEVARLAGPAGLGEVEGPTYVVTLDDAPSGVVREGLRADELVVHQQDIQAVVNALWAGGAEAMTLMGHRIVSTTAVRCVGNTVLIQDRLYSPPYEIVAIGDLDRFRAALNSSPEVGIYREYVDQVGLGWTARPGGRQVLPAYDGPLEIRYARPLPAASPAASPEAVPDVVPGGPPVDESG